MGGSSGRGGIIAIFALRIPRFRVSAQCCTCSRYPSFRAPEAITTIKGEPGMLRAAITWPVGLFLCALGLSANAEWGINMRRGVTDVSQSVFDLHMTIFWICVV